MMNRRTNSLSQFTRKESKASRLLLAVLAAVLSPTLSGAAVPHQVNHQGVVSVNGQRIKQGGDVGHVTQYEVGESKQKQVGQGHETFETEKLKANRISIPADQVWSHAFEFDDLVEMQTILNNPAAELRGKMLSSPICDGEKFAEGFAVRMRDIWRDWCKSQGG